MPMAMHQGPYAQGPMTPPPMTPPPMQQQMGGYGPPPRQQPSSNGPIIAGIGCAVLLVLAIVVFVIAVAIGGDDDDKRTTVLPSYTAPSYTPPSYTPPSSSSDRLPANFSGSWKGRGYQPTAPTDKFWDVQYTLLGGYSTGLVSYSATGYSCRGLLRLESGANSYKAVYRITITSGQCLSGYVTFYSISSTSLRFEERKLLTDGTPLATGSLSKP